MATMMEDVYSSPRIRGMNRSEIGIAAIRNRQYILRLIVAKGENGGRRELLRTYERRFGVQPDIRIRRP